MSLINTEFADIKSFALFTFRIIALWLNRLYQLLITKKNKHIE